MSVVTVPCSSANLTTSSLHSHGDPVFRCTQNVSSALFRTMAIQIALPSLNVEIRHRGMELFTEMNVFWNVTSFGFGMQVQVCRRNVARLYSGLTGNCVEPNTEGTGKGR